jgi:anthranilate/para-aminobenzoate synthase component II
MDPVRAGLLDVVHAAARQCVPTLGVCLGHQALGLAFGAHLLKVKPAHGKQSVVTFGLSRLFPGITGPHTVMRYHSLALVDVAAPLHVVATTADGLVMAMEHAQLPMASFQFHPDSHGTPHGTRMVHAFFQALKLGGPR